MYTKDDFKTYIHTFSHEIRSPLTAASSTLQLLEMKYPYLQQEPYFLGLTEDLRHMTNLISDFTHFLGRTRFQPIYFPMETLLQECVLSFAATLPEQGPSFTSKISLAEVSYCGDPTRLKELIYNLLNNAKEASSPTDSIRLDAYLETSKICICISDTGCGIASEQLPHIFEPFVTYKRNGNGLGLSICKQIADLHQGNLEVFSTIGEGTTFLFTLPTEEKR